MAERLEVILKLTERCNIACTYCYYFENAAKSALSRPAILTDKAADAFIRRTQEAFICDHYKRIRVIFHGGEPMMYGKERFRNLCKELTALPKERIELCMQTNATLVDDEWINIFEEFNIQIGVSIDGPAEVHDRHRIDKKGKPTHSSVVKGIGLLTSAAREGRIGMPGALIVMQKETDARSILRYLIDELKLTQMDFLLPDATADDNFDVTWTGKYLINLLHAWLDSEQENTNIRFIRSTLSMLLGGRSYLGGYGPERSNALTVLSNGEINGDDFLRPCGDDFIDLNSSVFDISFKQAEMLNNFRLTAVKADDIPDDCIHCAYRNTCNGGQLTHRFSSGRLFNNPTIYCKELKEFYGVACEKLIQSGIPIQQIEYTLSRQIQAPQPATLTIQ